MAFSNKEMATVLFVVLGLGFGLFLDLSSGFKVSASGVHESRVGHHCDHGHDHHHHHHHDHHHHHKQSSVEFKLPEELAEEEDMKLYGFGSHSQDHDHEHFGILQLSGPGNSSNFRCIGLVQWLKWSGWFLGLIDKCNLCITAVHLVDFG